MDRILKLAVVAVWIAACENPQPPVPCGPIPQQTVFVGESAAVQACFDDPDGDMLAYAVATSDPGVATAAVTGNTVTVEGVAPGSATVTVTATDVGGLESESRFEVAVPNRAPISVGVIQSLELAVGDSTQVDVSAHFSDPDGQGLAYAAATSDAGIATVSATGVELTLRAHAKGVATVTVTATDPGGMAATQSFTLTVPNQPPQPVGALPVQTIEVGQAATVDILPFFSDPDGDDLVFSVAVNDAALAAAEVSGSLVEVTALARGLATVTVTATDTEGASATQSFEVTVPNQAPLAVGEIPAQTVEVGHEVLLEMGPFFMDPDGDVLAYEVVTSDAALAAAGVEGGVVTVAALAKGNATVTVTATDIEGASATQTFAVTVPNRPPAVAGEIPAQTVEVGEERTLEPGMYFADPDGDPLAYAVEAADAAVVTASMAGGTVVLAAMAKGEVTVTVTATDDEGSTATQAFAVTVPNRAPVAEGVVEERTIEVGQAATVDILPFFSDPDGDDLVFSVAVNDAALAAAEVSGSLVEVTALARGLATVTVTATDTEGASATQSFEVTVPNQAPLAVGEIPAQTVEVGHEVLLEMGPFFMDPDGDVLAYEVVTSDAALAAAGVEGGVVTVAALAKGNATVTVTATDIEGASATQTFAVSVPNRPPAVAGEIPAQTVEVGEERTLEPGMYFADPDGDPLAYAVEAADAAVVTASMAGGTVVLAAMAKGEVTVTVTATDDEGSTATQAFAVTVPNRAPVAEGVVEERTIEVGQAATVDILPFFSDPDGDDLVFSVAVNDAALAAAEVSGSLVEVTALARGLATVTVTATDTEGASATQSFEVTVPNQAPLAVGEIPAQTVEVGHEVLLEMGPFFMDPDGDVLAYEVVTSDAALAAAGVEGGVVTVAALAKGNATVTVTATDIEGASATQTFAVSVPNRPPAVAGEIPAQTVEVGEERTLEPGMYFADPDGDPLAYAVEAADAAVVTASMAGGMMVLAAMARGETSATITATDTQGLSATQSFTVIVPNQVPVADNPILPWTLEVGDAATLDLSGHFTDPDGDSLAFAAAPSDTAVVRVELADAVLTMTAIARGGTTVTVTASDGDGLSGTQTFTVVVSNQPPVAVGSLEARTLTAGDTATLELSPHFSDPDGDALNFAATVSDTTVALVSVSGTTLAVAAAAMGEATVTVTATDTDGLAATQEFAVTVTTRNRTPVAVGTLPELRLTAGGVVRIEPVTIFEDPDGDTLVFDAESSDPQVAKVWVSMDMVLVRGVAKGTATVTVTARDPSGLSTTLDFQVRVRKAREPQPNRPPQAVGEIPDQVVEAGDLFALDAASYFKDPDHDALEFTVASSNVAVVSASLSGTEITLEAIASGPATVTVGASDPDGLAATLDFDVFVGDPTSGAAQCRNGFAGEFPCRGINLLSRLTREQMGVSFAHEALVNDVWGWTDPVTGTEWALVGHDTGVSFINLRNPLRPVYAGIMPLTPGSSSSLWRDIKVYGNYAYVVADQSDNGMQVFDLTQLRSASGPPRTFSATTTYTRILSAHNIVINEETGYAYSVGGLGGDDTCGGGLHMIDIRTPADPQFLGCFADTSTGQRNTGYTHDAMCVTYRGPDTEHQGKEVCFSSNETRLSIADVSDKENPVALVSASYPSVGYAHQGWLDDEHEYFYMNDELDEYNDGSNTRTLVWDVKDLADPVIATEFIHDTRAIDHNIYIVGNLMYQSNYLAGLRVLNIANRTSPVEIAYFDTNPEGGEVAEFEGSWSNYPFFSSGVIPVTSTDHGVFFVKLSN